MKRRARASHAECRRTNNAAINLSSVGRSDSTLHSCWHTDIGGRRRLLKIFCIMRLHVSWIFRGRQTDDTPSDRYYLVSDTGCALFSRFYLWHKIRSQTLQSRSTNTSRHCLLHPNERLQRFIKHLSLYE